MRKLLYIDIWEKGYRNFTRIDSTFKNNGYDTLLVHTGSFLNKIDKTEKVIEGLLLRDISFYNSILIKDVIDIEKPDVIIILNLSFVFDRSIVNFCKYRDIKVVYLSHGKLIAPDSIAEESQKLNSTIWRNVRRIFTRKNLFVLFNYLVSLKGVSIVMNPIKLVLGVMIRPSNYLTFAKYNKELDADLLLVYSEEDKALLSNELGFPEYKIKVVGNPEITAFMSQPTLPKMYFLDKSSSIDCKYLVYLDDGLVCDKIISSNEWKESLSELVDMTNKSGLKFILKLHPRTDQELYSDFFESKGIISIKDCDFKNLLEHSEFVISHLSTTILYALLFFKNVYIPYWGKFANLCKNYPEGVVEYVTSLSDLQNLTTLNKDNDKNVILAYLNANAIDLNVNSINRVYREVSKL